MGSLLPILSRAARDDQERLGFGFQRTVDVSFVAGTGFTVVTFAGAPVAMSILTGSATGPAVCVLEISR